MDKTQLKPVIDAFTEVFKTMHKNTYHNMDKLKLYPGQPRLLAIINAHEGITQKELAEKNFVQPATITGMLNKLEANNYVYRAPDESDKRIIHVYLTPEGKELAEKSECYIVELTEKMFIGFTEEELKTFVTLVKKIRNNLQ